MSWHCRYWRTWSFQDPFCKGARCGQSGGHFPKRIKACRRPLSSAHMSTLPRAMKRTGLGNMLAHSTSSSALFRRRICRSATTSSSSTRKGGSPAQIHAMLTLAEEKKVRPWVEERPMDDANQVSLDLENGLPRYRYVLVNK